MARPFPFLSCLMSVTALSLSPPLAAGSKLLATGGAVQIEGSAGGGLVPWAVIGGYGADGEWGASVGANRTRVDDFQLDSMSVLVGWDNRVEVSVSRHSLAVEPLAATIDQHILGAKVRLAGDLIYGSWPQFSMGLQYKHNRDSHIPVALGAARNEGYDIYASATKLLLDGWFHRNWLLGATLRRTDANQIGLLGFGAGGERDYAWVAEATVGVFLTRHWIAGYEYRQKPDRLVVDEDAWRDLFVAWFPNKRASVVLAYADLGDIGGFEDQQGWYLAAQVTY